MTEATYYGFQGSYYSTMNMGCSGRRNAKYAAEASSAKMKLGGNKRRRGRPSKPGVRKHEIAKYISTNARQPRYSASGNRVCISAVLNRGQCSIAKYGVSIGSAGMARKLSAALARQ
jgi:hypothetical protein